MESRAQQTEREVRALLDAMDDQWGEPVFSYNVDQARRILRARFPKVLRSADQSREKAVA